MLEALGKFCKWFANGNTFQALIEFLSGNLSILKN